MGTSRYLLGVPWLGPLELFCEKVEVLDDVAAGDFNRERLNFLAPRLWYRTVWGTQAINKELARRRKVPPDAVETPPGHVETYILIDCQ